MRSTRALPFALLAIAAACAPAEPVAPQEPAARRSADPTALQSATTSASAGPLRTAPAHVDAVVIDKAGRVQRLQTENTIRECLSDAPVGDRGTLIVTAGEKGWAEPELEIDGLSMPFVRCLMGHVTESFQSVPMAPDTVIYVSVQ